jgi:dTDP-4-dehydrorhamnose reductase
MQTVLVTGANGFVGAYLTQELLTKGFFVVATGKGPSRLPFQSDHLRYESLDFTNEEEVGILFNKYKPSVVMHSGAMSKPDECELNREAAFRTNVSGTIHLLSNAEKLKSFFVFVSTDFVFSGTKQIYREDDTDTLPVNYYGETKLLAEEEVKRYEYGWAIARTVLVYGKPLQNRQNILTNTAAALRRNEVLKIFDDQLRTPTFVGDLVSGLVAIVKKNASGIFHLSGADILTPYQMAIEVAKHLELDASLISKVTWNDFQQPAKRPARTIFDISKAKNALGYMPLSFSEGLKKTFPTISPETKGF